MGELLLKLLSGIDNPNLTTLLVSMFPLVELKGGIPIGTGLDLPLIISALLSYSGSSLIVIPIFFLLIPIFNLLKKIKLIRKIVEKIEAVFDKKANDIAKKNNGAPEQQVRKFLMLALFIFVAVPFPVTGVWTGTGIAVFLNMKFKDAFLPIVLGNLVAGILITLMTFLFQAYVDIIIDVLFVIAIIMLIVFIVKVIKSKPQTNKE
ncbi:MAG: small multi-drug export protein [Clostridia bacterium]|nr:small multi-drug export protein [Clostridia bacterium]